jgi:hypothetical protein
LCQSNGVIEARTWLASFEPTKPHAPLTYYPWIPSATLRLSYFLKVKIAFQSADEMWLKVDETYRQIIDWLTRNEKPEDDSGFSAHQVIKSIDGQWDEFIRTFLWLRPAPGSAD